MLYGMRTQPIMPQTTNSSRVTYPYHYQIEQIRRNPRKKKKKNEPKHVSVKCNMR